MKTLHFSIILVVLLLQFNSSAQIIPGAKQISISHSGIALSHDVFTHFSNPAGLDQMDWREAGIFYSPSPFGLTELANAFAVYHEPTKYGSFGIGFKTYGFNLYRETDFSFSYSKRIYKHYFAGLRINYRNLAITNYGNTNTIIFSLASLIYIRSDLRAGFAVDNFTRASYKNYSDQIPLVLTFGFSYDMLDDLILNLAYSQETDFDPSVKFGIDYSLIKYLNVRFGFSTVPSSFSAGVGINYSLFDFDYAVFNHQDLGFTHQAGLVIHFTISSSRMERIKNYLKL